LKVLRFFLTCLATLVALAILIVAMAFAPPVQTWFARMELLDLPGVQGSLGSLSAAFGKLNLEDLKLQYGRTVLTLPSLQARLPLIKAAWKRQILVQSVVAKGWTLDLSHLRDEEPDVLAPEAGTDANSNPATSAAPERQAAFAFGGILAGRRLPFDGSLDGVDLDGDVLVAASPGKAPVRVHVTVKGGGMAQGREGSFTVEASRVPEDSDSTENQPSAHCRVVVAMDSPRTVGRIELKADLSGLNGSQQEGITLSAVAAKAGGAGDETYAVDLSRRDRHLAILDVRYPAASRQLTGTWKVDLRDSDLAPFGLQGPLPSLAAAGDGHFDADTSFERVHAVGRLVTVAGRLGAVAPVLERLGVVTVDSQFDLTRNGPSIHFESLVASLGRDRPSVFTRALQPFDIDWATGAVRSGDPRRDWMEVSVREFPLSRLPVLPGGLVFSGGDAAGEFAVRAADGGFTVRPKTVLTAADVSVERSGKTVGRHLDLSVSMLADLGAKQWQFQWSPITIDSAGRRLATIEAKGSRSVGANQSLAVGGSWKADLDSIASLSAVPALSWITGRVASGDFTGNIGASSDVECKLTVVGHDPAHTVSATINADIDPGGAGELLAPVKIAFGPEVSDVTVEVSWPGEKSERRTEIKLSSESVALGHLRLLAAALAAVGGVPLPSHSSGGGASWAAAGVRDQVPFWGDWVGRVDITFDKLRTGDQDYTDVGGTFEVDNASIQLEGGHGELPSKSMANIEGSILFDAASDHPYLLKGTASGLSNLDAALVLPPEPGHDPMIEGHFTVAGSVSGAGINLDDLIAGTQEEFQLSSVNGIIRLLRTDIADVIPEASEPVSDSLGDVGNFVGSILGIKGHTIDPGKNKIAKTADAVINFTNQVGEIGYDKITITAIRGSDRTIRLANLEMTAPDEHLKGSGQITYVKGLPISAEPLSVEFQLGVRDVLIKLLKTAGLLSPEKDSLGYSLLARPVRFGGTLAHVDDKQWHDLLAKAATQKPPAAKKDAPVGTR
jgi:hypothetical protein